MKKENGIYVDFCVVKDGLELPIRTMNLRELSRILTEGIIENIENIISPEKERKMIKIKTLTGELLEQFPFFGLTNYFRMDDGSIILCNDGGKIGVACKDGKFELIPYHDKKFPSEYTGDGSKNCVYIQFVTEIDGEKCTWKKIELKDGISVGGIFDMIQEVDLYAKSKGLEKGWENIKEICKELQGEHKEGYSDNS